MSDEIAVVSTTGQHAYIEPADMPEPAWHRLGKRFTEPNMLPTTALQEIGGDFEMSLGNFKVEVQTPTGPIYVDNQSAYRVIVRHPCNLDDKYRVWEKVSDQFSIIRPAEFASALDVLAKPYGDGSTRLRLTGAGYLRAGAVMFMTFEGSTFGVMVNGKYDVNTLFLNWVSKNDGSGSNYAALDPTRIVCANTLARVDGKAALRFNFGHRGESLELTKGAAEIFAAVASREKAIHDAMQKMADFKVSKSQENAIFRYAAPYPARPKLLDLDAQAKGKIAPEKVERAESVYQYAIERADAYKRKFEAAYYGEVGNSAGLDGNLYGVLQTVAQVTDHYSVGKVNVASATIALSAVEGDRYRMKTRASSAALAVLRGKEIPMLQNEDLLFNSPEFEPLIVY